MAEGEPPRRPVGAAAPASGASDPLWVEASAWQEHVAACVAFPAGLSVLELCGGAATGQCALDLLLGQGRSQCVGLYDNAAECGPVVRRVLGGGHGAVHLGPHGDILRIPESRFPSANAVVSGPPCPPWSSMGQRRSVDDPRASVFMKVISVIAELAGRVGQCRPLLFFVGENVEGFTHTVGGGRSGFDEVIARLRAELPQHWRLGLLRLNSADYGLPQSRGRVFLVGRSGQWFPRGPVPRPPVFGPTPPLRPFLCVRAVRAARVCFTAIQAQNLADWKAAFVTSMADTAYAGQCAVVDLSRTPSGRTGWGGLRPREDLCQCLTASGPVLHIFALGEGTGGQLSVDRLMRANERGAIQGFPARVASVDLPEPVARRIFGNAMSVPVIGSVLRQLLAERGEKRLRGGLREWGAGGARQWGQ